MFFWKKEKGSDKKEQAGGKAPAVSVTVSCPNNCTRINCSSLDEAETFRSVMKRCSQCGEELVIRK